MAGLAVDLVKPIFSDSDAPEKVRSDMSPATTEKTLPIGARGVKPIPFQE
jgi:hypothetical protein